MGEPSWSVGSTGAEVFVAQLGGHAGPIFYNVDGRKVAPYNVAPWAVEPPDPAVPVMLRVLRGDFFCLPFGGNDSPFGEEVFPPHGETAGSPWSFESLQQTAGEHVLCLGMETHIRKGRAQKRIRVVDGHSAVYSQHVVSGMSGPMTIGHHAMIRFPDRPGSGLVSTSRFVYGQVYVEEMELPEKRGYSCLQPGAEFQSLSSVAMARGGVANLEVYPARRGYEDLVMMVADPDLPFGWTAVVFPEERFVWFALKDQRVLRNTIFWMSNGGRYFAPWNGRHVNVLGIEDVTAYFHYGLAESAAPNPISEKGYPTCVRLDASRPLVVNYIMAAAVIPDGFDRVADITVGKGGDSVVLTSSSGKTTETTIDMGFLGAR